MTGLTHIATLSPHNNTQSNWVVDFLQLAIAVSKTWVTV